VLRGFLSGCKLAPTALEFPLLAGKLGSLRRLAFAFPFGSTASFPHRTPLLLFGIIGLAGALLGIKEGRVAFFVEKLQNITKDHLFMLRTG
jgi:hypothetical protein